MGILESKEALGNLDGGEVSICWCARGWAALECMQLVPDVC